MIGIEWLMQISALADASLSENEATRLAGDLGEEREVLPHFLLHRALFAEWPKSRAALREVGRTVIRPRAISTDARELGRVREFAACKQNILRNLGTNDGDAAPSRDLAHYRALLSPSPRPNDFIEND